MDIELSDEALEYGRQAHRAFEAAGGDGLVQQAESEPAHRAERIELALGELGAWDLDVRQSVDELEAAAALCRSAGWWALPYPLAERLARPADVEADGLVVVGDGRPAAALDGLPHRWVAQHLDGRRARATARPADEPARKTSFVIDLDLVALDDAGTARDLALGLVLPCWTLLGMLDRAIDLTRAYVLEREQFGQRLATFQGVQFQLTDAEVERVGLEQLARYALWSLEVDGADADPVADALALRLAALDAADVVFRTCHQLHGAIGFCDETALSWVSRHSQPLRRLPLGQAATQDALARAVGRRGLVGIYGGADAPPS